ncbi:MAG: nuclear transport factor 2 family protein [Saprospiraceae bacterium]|jgi:hypothetical protein|nr:nuclear transport factor 2 family protein [Saprospiraceae bacterium]
MNLIFTKLKEETKTNNDTGSYSIGNMSFCTLCNSALEVFASGDYAPLYEVLTPDAELFFPQGIDEQRRNIQGIQNIFDFWQTWRISNNTIAMTITEINSVPVIVSGSVVGPAKPGTWVFSWFNVNVNFVHVQRAARVNATFSFNEESMIQKIFTYYDPNQFNNL